MKNKKIYWTEKDLEKGRVKILEAWDILWCGLPPKEQNQSKIKRYKDIINPDDKEDREEHNE